MKILNNENTIFNIVVLIIKNGISSEINIANVLSNKKIILFGIPGAFTPTCSEKHFPGYLKLFKQFKNKQKMKSIVYLLMSLRYDFLVTKLFRK